MTKIERTLAADGIRDAALVVRALRAAVPAGTTHLALLIALCDMSGECLASAPSLLPKELFSRFIGGLRLYVEQRVEDLARAKKDDQ